MVLMSASDHLSGIQFHSTRSPEFPGSEWVHVGTRTAAVNRARDWSEELKRRGEPDSPVHLHQVEIHGGPRSMSTETDEVANWIERNPGEYKHPYKVIPYTNEWEDPGSTSYLVHRSAIRSLGSEVL